MMMRYVSTITAATAVAVAWCYCWLTSGAALRRVRRDDRGEGLIAVIIVVAIVALLGVGFLAKSESAQDKVFGLVDAVLGS